MDKAPEANLTHIFGLDHAKRYRGVVSPGTVTMFESA